MTTVSSADKNIVNDHQDAKYRGETVEAKINDG